MPKANTKFKFNLWITDNNEPNGSVMLHFQILEQAEELYNEPIQCSYNDIIFKFAHASRPGIYKEPDVNICLICLRSERTSISNTNISSVPFDSRFTAEAVREQVLIAITQMLEAVYYARDVTPESIEPDKKYVFYNDNPQDTTEGILIYDLGLLKNIHPVCYRYYMERTYNNSIPEKLHFKNILKSNVSFKITDSKTYSFEIDE